MEILITLRLALLDETPKPEYWDWHDALDLDAEESVIIEAYEEV